MCTTLAFSISMGSLQSCGCWANRGKQGMSWRRSSFETLDSTRHHFTAPTSPRGEAKTACLWSFMVAEVT